MLKKMLYTLPFNTFTWVALFHGFCDLNCGNLLVYFDNRYHNLGSIYKVPSMNIE